MPSELAEPTTRHPSGRGPVGFVQFSVESARAAFFPQIQLTATTGVQSAALASLFGPGAWFYTLAAGLTQPIFDGFLLESQLKQAKGLQLQYCRLIARRCCRRSPTSRRPSWRFSQSTLQERLQAQAVTDSRKAFEVSEPSCGRHGQLSSRCCRPSRRSSPNENTIGASAVDQAARPSSLFQAWAADGSRTAAVVTGTVPRPLPPQP